MKIEEIKKLIIQNYPFLDMQQVTDKWFYFMDTERKIVFANEQAIKYLFRGQNPVGRNICELLPYISDSFTLSERALKTGIVYRNIVQAYVDKNGRWEAAICSLFPIRKDGKIIGVCDLGEDISSSVNLYKNDFLTQTVLHEKLMKYYEVSKHQEIYYTIDSIIGSSSTVKNMKAQIMQAAASDYPLFIYGETGTGKELVAQAVYTMGRDYRKNPFLAQNCAAIPESLLESILFGTVKGAFTGAESKAGLFESANGGVVYLDEINSMPLTLQAKLLRVLEDKRITRVGSIKDINTNFRLISSSNVSSDTLFRENIIRQDLYYRLNVLYIEVPPLRQRKEDIPLLVHHFIDQSNRCLKKKVAGLSNRAMDKIMQHDWPGNIRELRNVIESAVNQVCSDIIDVDDICIYCRNQVRKVGERVGYSREFEETSVKPFRGTLNKVMYETERNLIAEALERNHGNASSAARELGIPQSTMYDKLRRFELIQYCKNLTKIPINR